MIWVRFLMNSCVIFALIFLSRCVRPISPSLFCCFSILSIFRCVCVCVCCIDRVSSLVVYFRYFLKPSSLYPMIWCNIRPKIWPINLYLIAVFFLSMLLLFLGHSISVEITGSRARVRIFFSPLCLWLKTLFGSWKRRKPRRRFAAFGSLLVL